MEKVKLNQYIAQATGMSRREASEEIKAGKIKINGRKALFWEEIDPKEDSILYQGKKITLPEHTTTIILNKPVGYVTTRDDEFGRDIVMDLLPENLQYLKPVGRLDADSEGLLILTDDGDKIYEWTHPKFEHEKEYVLTLKKPITEELLQKFIKGVKLQEGIAVADYVEPIWKSHSGSMSPNFARKLVKNSSKYPDIPQKFFTSSRTKFENISSKADSQTGSEKISTKELNIVIHQGWKRQLRRMAEKCGNEVTKLKRIRMGDITLDDLPSGEWKKVDL
ncbi:pseudouridine synthase [Patescibacteria group bacterium]